LIEDLKLEKMPKVNLNFLKKLSFLKKMDRNSILITIAIIAIVITGVLIYVNQRGGLTMPSFFRMSDKQLAEKAVNYINTSGISASKVSLVSYSVESGLVKIKIKVGTSEFDSYVTKDGKYLFAQAFDMNPKTDKAAGDKTNNQTAAKTTVEKSDNPMLEAFVVARCPYGLQMQRAMLEAVKNQPSLAQYIKARYIGSVSGNTITAMHGEAEAKENLRQICIREEQSDKYWNYVGCQMKASGTEVSCEKSTGVDSNKLSSCISDTKRGVAYAKKDFDLADKYGVSGSPTLILNGASVDESSYGGRSADGVKSMACAGFKTAAGFCSAKLSTAEAAVSFSASYSSGNDAASAGSGSGCQAAE